MFEYRRGGRKISANDFFSGLAEEALDKVVNAYAEEIHGKAASVVDPETGKHAAVFVRRVGRESLSIHANGSPEFARALEGRIGVNIGEIYGMAEPAMKKRLVYLAHGSENKDIAKPLAEGLMQRGIDVWYDNWEIGYGDSLRRKMEEGLGDCTHFVALLTDISIKKPWVNEEIDAGLMGAVEGTAKFIGLRHKLSLRDLSPFLRTRLTPEFKLDDESLDALAAEIMGVSKKPPLGDNPRYVRNFKPGSTWSNAAMIVAEYFVHKSEHGQSMDPQTTYEEIQKETSLPMPDVRIGVLDLLGSGLLEKQDYFGGNSSIWPKADLFTAFDGEFMDWSPEKDARNLAVYLLNLDKEYASSNEVGEALGWQPRRFNPAAAYLASARVVKTREYMGGGDNYFPQGLVLGDELLRFVRSL